MHGGDRQPTIDEPRRRQKRTGDPKMPGAGGAGGVRGVGGVRVVAAPPPVTAQDALRRMIGEAASEDVIRRRYRQLALQLHPDKNRHHKAEVAFKVVSKAHACLTDKARRRAFDAERRASFCATCHHRHVLSQSTAGASARHRAVAIDKRTTVAGATAQAAAVAAKPRVRKPPAVSSAQSLREVQNRMREECRAIDSCLRANTAGAGQNQRWCKSGGESPVYPIKTSPQERATGIHRRSW